LSTPVGLTALSARIAARSPNRPALSAGHGKQFIECFYAYHSNLSPPSEKWPKDKFEKYDAKTMYDDLFVHGYDDMAILQPTYLADFYKHGFNTTDRNSAMKKSHPERFILNSAFDPRDGNKGLEALHANCEKFDVKGVKLYTVEWRGGSKGYKLTDKESYKFLEAAQKYGIKNIHVHKGPTIIPLNRDAFDVADIDDVATSFQDLNFIVEHCGLPRLDASLNRRAVMSSIKRCRNGLMGLADIAKAPVSHGVEPHDLETGLRLSRSSSLLQTIQPPLATPTARAVSFSGGERAYTGCLGKDRS
jgi:Amidohydrolase